MNLSSMRYEVGSKDCGLCGTKDKIIQFERKSIRQGLPIIEIAFLCESCAKKHNLIKNSPQGQGDEKK
jgi:hypothetical protein